jgi:hypothetical protein
VRYPLRDDLGSDRFPFWRDGKTLGFTTWSAGVRHLRERDIDGAGPVRLVQDRATNAGGSRDGRYAWFSYGGLKFIERGSAEPRTIDEGGWYYADISPNGRFLAATRYGEPGVLVRRFPDGSGVTAVTSRDTLGVRWGADGRELFFWAADDETLVSVPFDTEGEDPRPGPPRTLFPAAAGRFYTGPDFDVAPDGRFLMLQGLENARGVPADPGIVIIQNWRHGGL